jgi:integrase
MALVKLTKRFVESALPGEYRDTELRGFVLVVTARGHRGFQVRYRLPHRRGTHTYGSYPAMTVEQARTVAQAKLFAISQGIDPSAEKHAARMAWTVKQLADHYIEEHLPRLRESSRIGYCQHLRKYIIPAMGRQTVAEVTRADVLRMFRDVQRQARKLDGEQVVRTGATAANRVLATASSMFSEAIAQGLRTDNPCASVKRNPENRRERYLDATETARLLASCDKSAHINSAFLIRLLVFTGARRGETILARWADFDLKAAIWVKPSQHTKQNRTHIVPLSPASIAVLADMKGNAGDCQYLFPGANPNSPMQDPKRGVALIFKAAGFGKDVTLHTLRHSFAARVVSAGHGLHAAGKLLGHTQSATTHRYAHLEFDAQRRALNDVDSAIATATFLLAGD